MNTEDKNSCNLCTIKAKVRLLNDKELSLFFAWIKEFEK